MIYDICYIILKGWLQFVLSLGKRREREKGEIYSGDNINNNNNNNNNNIKTLT